MLAFDGLLCDLCMLVRHGGDGEKGQLRQPIAKAGFCYGFILFRKTAYSERLRGGGRHNEEVIRWLRLMWLARFQVVKYL